MILDNRWIEKIKFFYTFLFPPFCLNCGREGDYICDQCSLFLIESENCLKANRSLKNKQKQLSIDQYLIAWENNIFFRKVRDVIYSQKSYHVLEFLSEKALKIFIDNPDLKYFWSAWFNPSTEIIAVNSPEESKRNLLLAEIIIDRFVKLTNRRDNLMKTSDQRNIILVSFCWHKELFSVAETLKDKNFNIIIWALVLTGEPC